MVMTAGAADVHAGTRYMCARRSFPYFLTQCRILADDPEVWRRAQEIAGADAEADELFDRVSELAATVPFIPYDFQLERAEAWQAGDSEIVLKARQEGLTWLAAAYALWLARFFPGPDIGVFSKGGKDAKALLRRIKFLHNSLPPELRDGEAEITSELAKFGNGSLIISFASTVDSGLGYTFRLILFDEAAAHPWGAENYAALRPAISAGGQIIIFSTSNPELGPSGFFYDQVTNARAGLSPYKFVFIPWHARPGRDAAWLERERQAFVGLDEAFFAYYPSTPDEAFVARSGLVHKAFDLNLHVKPARVAWADCVRRVAGVDFGGGHPTAVVILGMDEQQHIHQYAEFYERGAVDAEQLVEFLSRWPGLETVECDPSQGITINTMVRFGAPAVPADSKRGEGISFVEWLLKRNRLTIEPSCTESVKEFYGYRWATKRDPTTKATYATKTPVDNHADAMDARRYAVLELMHVVRGDSFELPTTTASGRAPRRKAV